MRKFSISRIHTAKGIFKLQGCIRASHKNNLVEYHKVEFMDTDGWCEMDLESPVTQSLLSAIQNEIINHVKGNYLK